MKPEKVLEVIQIYRRKFEEYGVRKTDFNYDELLRIPERGIEHCHAMLDKMEIFVAENRMEKVFRWLGFVQGFLWAHGVYTLAELMNHNRERCMHERLDFDGICLSCGADCRADC